MPGFGKGKKKVSQARKIIKKTFSRALGGIFWTTPYSSTRFGAKKTRENN